MKSIEKKLDKLWFETVAKKANFRCEICSTPAWGVPAHHIYGRWKTVRWDIENGIQLCYKCHQKAHENVTKFRKEYGNERLDKLKNQYIKNIDYDKIEKELNEILK